MIFEERELARADTDTGEVKNLTKGTTITDEALPEGSHPLQILTAGWLGRFVQQEKAG